MPPKAIDRRRRGHIASDQEEATKLFAAFLADTKNIPWAPPKITEIVSGKAIACSSPQVQVAVVHEAVARLAKFAKTLRKEDINYHGRSGYSRAVVELLRLLFRRNLPYSEDEVTEILELVVTFPHIDLYLLPHIDGLVRTIELRAQRNSVSP